MSNLLLFASILFASACSSIQPKIPINPPPGENREVIGKNVYATKIQDGVYVIKHDVDFAPANSLIVDMAPDEILMVDTPYTPGATRSVLQWLESKYGRRKITAVNSHSHVDRLGGNEVLSSVGIPIYGSDETARRLKSLSRWERGNLVKISRDNDLRHEFETLNFTAPNHLFKLGDGKQLKFNDETVEIFYPGPAHTPDNVVVYLSKRRILFGGCMIVAAPKLGFTGQADLKSWPQSLRNLKRFSFDLLIPGHGDSYSPNLLEHTLSLLADIQ
jgi:glyoxylase-like metal-dependent hydrolase (beta-lactamase superfamily II)